MSEKTEKDKMRNGSAKETQGMRRRQVLWGILMLFSLAVMLVAGIFAVKAAKERQGGMTPSYAASDAGNAVKNGENGQKGSAGRNGGQLAAAVKQEMGIWAVGKNGTGNGAQEGAAFKDGKPIGNVPNGSRADENAVDVGGSNISTSGAGKPIGDAAENGGKPDGNAMDGNNKSAGTAADDGQSKDGTENGKRGNKESGDSKPENNKPASKKEQGKPIKTQDADKTQDGEGDGADETDGADKTEETGGENEADGSEETSAPDEDTPVIAMTFDDGPFTKVTNRIMDVLLEYDAGATFFVVGSRIDTYSDTLKKVYENGFEIASHTWSHKNLNKLSQEEIIKEIGDTRDKLNTYVPVGNVLVRPPYGNANEDVRAVAGTSLINWTVDSQDWKSKNADKIIKQVLATVKDGDIILMHDLYESTAEAVEYLVPELVKRGYRIVSVSELFRLKGVALEEGILYRNPWDYY